MDTNERQRLRKEVIEKLDREGAIRKMLLAQKGIPLEEALDFGNCVLGINEKAEQDTVNHPSHYETGKFECIDVMIETQGIEAVQDFCICNAFKYLYRHNRKNGIEDIKKAKWYIDKYIELSERK